MQMANLKSDAFVFFGATGDLACKQIFPALQAMIKRGHFDMPIIGVARSAKSVDGLLARAHESLEKHGGVDARAFAALSAQLQYVNGDYGTPETFRNLRKALGVVPIIQPFRLMLDQIRPQAGSGWMFANSIGGALDLDNLADRVIKPVLKANGLKWKGWHAYRRGLATNLHELGIPDKVIQAILRHEDVKTTQRSYIKTLPSVVTEAMKRLEQRIACAADVQQVSVN